MNYFIKNKALVWAIIAALIINLAAVITVIVRVYSFHPPREKDNKCTHRPCAQTYIIEELALNPEQSALFIKMKKAHSDTVSLLHQTMSVQKKIISDQMSSLQPDTAIMFLAADELGKLYAQSRRLYIEHFFDVRSICDSTQIIKLAGIYGSVFCCDRNKDGEYPFNKHKKHQKCQVQKNKNSNY